MRCLLALGLGFTLAAFGCGGGKSKSMKMQPSNVDLSFSGDLQPILLGDIAGKLGCNGFVDCQNTCAGQGGDVAACIAMSCTPDVSPNGQSRFDTALGCGQQWCATSNDMSAARCMLSGGMLVNLDGSMPSPNDPTNGSNPMKACQGCLDDALAMLFKHACANPSSADCNPVLCADDVQLCLDDQP